MNNLLIMMFVKIFSPRNEEYIDYDVCLFLSISNNFRLGFVIAGLIELVQVSIASDIQVCLRCLT